ncbi:hypothetical protein U9M48_008341 [Paspalum notatum var. saurae]|uniref:Alpha-mannosidase n=1 Tax=Paspalum notatum var. saurae TaxID=547442 RepID=A0AAQ3SP70_PASNO
MHRGIAARGRAASPGVVSWAKGGLPQGKGGLRQGHQGMAFFQRWWAEQLPNIQAIVCKLVASGQIEFVNGGWCMHDEAAVHYIDMIDQTTLGHRMIKKQFNKTPSAGWQIDPFGHSAVQAYLLGAELGFNSLHFARIDYQDRERRKADKGLEVIWRGSRTFGSSAQIFTNVFPVNYSPPDGFGFEVLDEDIMPIQDDLQQFDNNVKERVNDFVAAAIAQANVTRTTHIMWTMGDDFSYQYAESWFRNMDKLIYHVNKDDRVHALYSTPSIYTDAKHASNESWPVKYDDYFPYADAKNAYWTGYYSSRPTFKRYVRVQSGYYLAARQIEFLLGRSSLGLFTTSLEDPMGIAQHHDAVSGTAKQHTTDDYSKRLALGASKVEKGVNIALTCLISSNRTCMSSVVKFSREKGDQFLLCPLLNISYCPSTEETISSAKNLAIVAYNPLGWDRSDFIRVPVNDENLVVKSSDGTIIDSQLVEVDSVSRKLAKFYVKAYLGIKTDKPPRYWLIFQASVPPMGWNSYYISRSTGTGHNSTVYVATMVSPSNDMVEVGPGPLKMSFSLASGQLKRIFNSVSGVDLPVEQRFFWYRSNEGDTVDSQASGAYIFRPNVTKPTIASSSVPLKVIHGPLINEVHQQFNSWIYQLPPVMASSPSYRGTAAARRSVFIVPSLNPSFRSSVTRLYKNKEHAEVEYTIGPIPIDDDIGKEVITRLTTNMVTNGIFYTDSNGRDFIKRVPLKVIRGPLVDEVHQQFSSWIYQITRLYKNKEHAEVEYTIRNYREDWDLQVTQPVAGNYYPPHTFLSSNTLTFQVNLGVYIADGKYELSVLVDRAVGASSIQDGQLEIMLHRRILKDDSRGVGEPLDEVVCVDQDCQGLTDETSSKSYSVAKATMMDANYSLPDNVAIVTLQNLDDGTTLLRLAHLFQAGEDPVYSVVAKVDLKKVFGKRTIKELTETNLSANQKKSEMKKLNWRVVGAQKVVPPR